MAGTGRTLLVLFLRMVHRAGLAQQIPIPQVLFVPGLFRETFCFF